MARLPWLADEPSVGVHPLAGVSAGDHELYLTRRARLTLRLPAGRVEAAGALAGSRLDLGGEVEVGVAQREAAVADQDAIFVLRHGRYRGSKASFSPHARLTWRRREFRRNWSAARRRSGRGEEGEWRGFSLMLFGLTLEDSLRMQREGLGGERKRGCGIFIPHKSVAAVERINRDRRRRMSDKPAVTIDLCGMPCPAPLLGAKKIIDDLQPGQTMVLLSDCPGTEDDLFAWCKFTGNELLSATSSRPTARLPIR